MESIVLLTLSASCVSMAAAAILIVPPSVEHLRCVIVRIRLTGSASALSRFGISMNEDSHDPSEEDGSGLRAALIAFFARLTKRDEKRLVAIRAALPGALQMLGSSIGAGQSNRQAFSYVAANTEGPLSRELMRTAWDLDAGRCMEEALEGLAERIQLTEIRMLCAAFAIQQRTGGNIRPIIESATASLREAAEFQRSLRVQTTQSRVSSRLVSAMPFVLLFLLAFISPGYLDAFFSSSAGVVLFFVALSLDAAGVFAIRHIVRIER